MIALSWVRVMQGVVLLSLQGNRDAKKASHISLDRYLYDRYASTIPQFY